MDFFDSQYFKMLKRVLIVCRLWPYQSNLKRRSNYVIFTITTFSLVFAMTAGIYTQANAELLTILETFCALCYCGGSLFAYTLLYARRFEIKRWSGIIADDWMKLTDDTERKIMGTCLLEARRAIFFFLAYGFPAYGVFVCASFLPRILSKESLEQRLHNFPYYFQPIIINEHTFDLQVCVHSAVAILFATSAFLSVNSTYITSVKHVCGLYGIARYRLQNAVVRNKNIDSLKESKEDTSIIIHRLINVIHIHKDALRSLQMIEENFSLGFFFLEIGALALLAVIMFEVNYHGGNVRELLRSLPMLLYIIMYLFFINWCGEQVVQSCDDLRMSAYSINWYRISSRIQIFVLMIMQKTAKPTHLTAGTVMLLSVQNFATILRTSWSFGMLLLTIQKPRRNKDTNFLGF